MSGTNLPDIGSPPTRLDPELRKWLVKAAEHIRELRGFTGDAAGQAGSGGGGGGGSVVIIPGAPPPAPAPGPADPPDLTPPPTPSGVVVTAGLAAIYIETDDPTFTQGHGYARTRVYGAKYPGTGPLPTFGSAVLVHEFIGEIGSFPSDLGTQWHIWVKWLTEDDVESSIPSGGTNGHVATTGKIGNADLGPLIVEAGNLASGAVTASKLAAGAVGLTAFAAGITPVEVVATLPASGNFVGRTVVLTTDGKLYRYTGAGWTAAVASGDIAGQLLDTQIAALAASKITGQLTNAQLQSIAAAKLTGQIVGTQITDGAISTPKLAAGAVTANEIAADTITASQIAAGAITAAKLAAGSVTSAKIVAGAVTTTALAAGAVTANELAANSVIAGKIAAGAVNADQIAARAVRTDKLLVTGAGAALNPDPLMQDDTAWTYYAQRGGSYSLVTITDGQAGTKAMRVNADAAPQSQAVTITAGRQYRVSVLARAIGSSGPRYIRVYRRDATGLLMGYLLTAIEPAIGTFEGVNFSTSWTRYVGRFTAEAGAVTCHLVVDCTATQAGNFELQDFRLEDLVEGSLIVDGSIVATKLAANAIAVGTAAIQNGAIVNAMIANATIDDAKIATLSVSKLTAGSLNVGAFIQSSAYITGVQGVRLSGDGGFEGRDTTSTRVFSLGASGAQPILKAGAQLEIRADGNAFFNGSGTFSGALSAATGTFAGSLTAATGTFAGSLSAATGTFAGSLTAATGSFSTSASGKRITLNESSSNEARFYGDRGDGTIELLASIGINSFGLDTVIGQFGNTNAGNARIGLAAQARAAVAVYGQSFSNAGVLGTSSSGNGVLGTVSNASTGVVGRNTSSGFGVLGDASGGSGAAVRGIAGSGPGVHGSAASGYGGFFVGNGSKPPLFVQPGNLGDATTGGISFIETGTDLGIVPVYAKAGTWYRFCDNRVYNSPTGDASPGGGGGGA